MPTKWKMENDPEYKKRQYELHGEWAENNRDKLRASYKRSYYNHHEERLAKARARNAARRPEERARVREWWNSEPKEWKQEFAFKNRLYTRTRVRIEWFNAKMEEQGGGCAICGKHYQKRKLSVDHNHACCEGRKSCGKCVRGLLCDVCNHRLSSVENVHWLEAAMNYLRKYATSTNSTKKKRSPLSLD